MEHVQAGVVLSTEHGFPYLKVIGTVLQGWELTRVGQVAAGLTQMREGLASFRLAMGAEIYGPTCSRCSPTPVGVVDRSRTGSARWRRRS